jgi:hypothetical protein
MITYSDLETSLSANPTLSFVREPSAGTVLFEDRA